MHAAARKGAAMASLLIRSLMICWWALILLNSAAAAGAAHAASIMKSKVSYPALFVFGDSVLDPGNRAIYSNPATYFTFKYPYGETFPGWPFGRYGDGHTLVDFLAEYMELPLVSPYLNSSADFRSGVNYAVGGATALNVSFLNSFGIYPNTNVSLDVQVASHLAYKASVESSNGSLKGSPTEVAFMDGLYIIEIGGNDQMCAYQVKYSPSFVISTLIPLVIHKVHNIVETLLDNGAKNLLFIPLPPLGCTPLLRAQYDGVKDDDGCLDEYNLASYLYGEYLHEEVENLRASYPNASFSYIEYYSAYKHIVEEKKNFGFINIFDACCGAGANYSYNYDPHHVCNVTSVSICANPNVYVSWDGVHFTDSFNSQLFNQTFIMGSYLDTPFSLM